MKRNEQLIVNVSVEINFPFCCTAQHFPRDLSYTINDVKSSNVQAKAGVSTYIHYLLVLLASPRLPERLA